jgi:nitrate reductase NapE component
MDEKNELEKNSNSSGTSPDPFEHVSDIQIPNIRTFKQDISQTIQQDKVTTAKILMAEQNKRVLEGKIETHEKVKTVKNTFAILASVILLVASVGLIGYFGYTKVNTKPPVVNPQASTFLFVYENEKFIDVSLTREDIERKIQEYQIEASQGAQGTYTELVFFKTDSKTSNAERISSLDFFRLFEIPVITNVARSLSQDFTYGLYTTEGRTEPFLVVGLIDYENAYSSMFTWETTLAIDVRNIFPVLKNLFDVSKIITAPQQSDIIATTTQNPLEPIEEQDEDAIEQDLQGEVVVPDDQVINLEAQETIETINRTIRFTDVILSNYNTRAVRNENGSPFFYYAFIGKDKILFAQDPKLIGEIIRKTKQRDLIR